MAIIVRDTMANGRETCFSKLIGTPLKMRAPIGEYLGTRVWEYQGEMLCCPGCKFPYPVVLESDLQFLNGHPASASDTTPAALPITTPAGDLVAA